MGVGRRRRWGGGGQGRGKEIVVTKASHKTCQNWNLDTRLTAFNRYWQDLSNELCFNVME